MNSPNEKKQDAKKQDLFNQIGSDTIANIYSFLTPPELSKLECVSKRDQKIAERLASNQTIKINGQDINRTLLEKLTKLELIIRDAGFHWSNERHILSTLQQHPKLAHKIMNDPFFSNSFRTTFPHLLDKSKTSIPGALIGACAGLVAAVFYTAVYTVFWLFYTLFAVGGIFMCTIPPVFSKIDALILFPFTLIGSVIYGAQAGYFKGVSNSIDNIRLNIGEAIFSTFFFVGHARNDLRQDDYDETYHIDGRGYFGLSKAFQYLANPTSITEIAAQYEQRQQTKASKQAEPVYVTQQRRLPSSTLKQTTHKPVYEQTEFTGSTEFNEQRAFILG